MASEFQQQPTDLFGFLMDLLEWGSCSGGGAAWRCQLKKNEGRFIFLGLAFLNPPAITKHFRYHKMEGSSSPNYISCMGIRHMDNYEKPTPKK